MVKVSELGQLLRSLCFQARWKYAVFWKFRGRSQTLLEWEDGYCVPSGSRPGMSEEPWNGYFNGESGLISFSRGMNSLTGSSTPCPIELAVSSMSCHLYSLGEGIVGKVASSRNPRWVIPKTFTSKIPEELQPQFAAGIKFHAILFVPIFPLGVIQLGSLESVGEDPRLVALVEDLFSTLLKDSLFMDSGVMGMASEFSLDQTSWGSIYGEICEDGVNGQYPSPDMSGIPIFSPEVNFLREMDWAFGEEPLWDLMSSELDELLGSSAWFSSENLRNSPSPSEESTNLFTKQDDLECLLDLVITEFLEPSGADSPSSSDDQLVGSCLTHIKSEVDPSVNPSTSHLESSLMSPNESQSRSSGSVVLDEEHTKRTEKKTGSSLTERGKTRPRPRDRQLIQDRIKELRELVPNASKCSIDTLLDRTIKLMQFLQSISMQGEKLKQYSQLKVKGKKRKRLEADVSACNFTSQAEACPIVVENLDQPGHLLVEVLCADYGFFLEIAQVIKHLDLTILRGVLETRSHELWAHFIVEGSRGFHRMDILWPLMQLLQRQSAPIASSF